ncbi:MAG: IS1634 family transposase, partial [Waterburya sp.]
LKKEVVQKTIEAAKSYYNFDYSIVFYDVTTLYFESFKDDELRKTGFSKDGKSQQPQILVALIVTKEGFPVGYDFFSGNTFEGHTIIPAIKSFVDQNTEVKLTVVADAAMISAANISELKEASINYIVGARLANCKKELIELIDNNLERADGKTIRIQTESGWLICGYSVKRYKKDKFEMDKQIEKAKEVVKNPSKAKKTKFTKAKESGLELNEDLTQKTEKLLGIKGYYTDLDESILSNSEVIERYHDLYKVEHAFRISKHDLQTRPIFHNKEEPIKLHILICFMSLAIARHIELQTGVSINKFISEAKKVADARMLNQITGKEIKIRAPISSAMSEIIEKLNPPH